MASVLTVGKVNEMLDRMAAAAALNQQPGEKQTAAKQVEVLRCTRGGEEGGALNQQPTYGEILPCEKRVTHRQQPRSSAGTLWPW